jgi:hypothetical protein
MFAVTILNKYYMQNFRILDLPNDPLKDKESLIKKYKLQSRLYDIENSSILKDEIIDLFNSVNLDIDSVVVFTTYASGMGSDNGRIIHTDVKWSQITNSWEKITVGVNWELTDVSGQFKWWNMDAVASVYPGSEKSLTYPFTQLSGIHYEQRMKLGIPAGAVLLEETNSNCPMLVRTDIPHSVTYTGTGRMSISIRFSNHLLEWSEAVDRLSTVIV